MFGRGLKAVALAVGAVLFAAAVFAAVRAWRMPVIVTVQLLAFNDFHGNLDLPEGSTGQIEATPAGGVEYLATHLARLKAQNPNTLIVSAGDDFGASPMLSALFHHEPTVQALDAAGLDLSAVGNHEFDDGWRELLRIQRGGCHPVDGCRDHGSFSGATYQYLAANVVLDPKAVDAATLAAIKWPAVVTDPRPLLPAFAVKEIDGVKVGFIGLSLQGTATIVLPESVKALTFLPEAAAANALVPELHRQGVQAIVVLIHQGGVPGRRLMDGCENVTGPIVNIAHDMSPDIDVIVSGHTHEAYNCVIDGKLVTSAASFGRVITDITLGIDRSTGRIVSKNAHNVVVTRDVDKAAAETAILEHYRPFCAPLANQVVGTAPDTIHVTANFAGESPFGDVVADSQLEAARAVSRENVVAAFQNPGGIRTDLVADPQGPAGKRPITYSTAYAALPFGNRLVIMNVTGEIIRQALEAQFAMVPIRMLQVSKGFTYAYDRRRPAGQRVDPKSIHVNGRAIDLNRSYRVTVNSFLSQGGDEFTSFVQGTDRTDAGSDLDALIAYLRKHSPVSPGSQRRIMRLDPPTPSARQ